MASKHFLAIGKMNHFHSDFSKLFFQVNFCKMLAQGDWKLGASLSVARGRIYQKPTMPRRPMSRRTTGEAAGPTDRRRILLHRSE
jgi:hypothetical protein